ncbi:MAG: HAMP domain-containing histidine kinase [Victivallales bacterium]|nr:HAMP domain-containing histidine kinase [Victivallales bacterium]
MRRIKYNILRWLTVAVSLVMTVAFCLLLLYMGSEEIRKAESYADTEKKYVELLLSCRAALNSTEKSFKSLQINIKPSAVNLLIDDSAGLRRHVNSLASQETKRTSRSFTFDSRLKDLAAALSSAAMALQTDLSEAEPETQLLIKDAVAEMADLIYLISSELQERLNIELDHVENWQNQSLFFFDRLEVTLVSFFVISTVSTSLAFLISGHVLRRYLALLTRGAHEISSGNLAYRFDDQTNDLIGGVMRDFDSMAGKLGAQTRDLKDINIKLRQKADELEQANMHKDKFLSNMSHELRTPLNSIIGFSDLICANCANYSPEKTKNHAEKILSAAEHLLELITDLLEIARIDSGMFAFEPETFEIDETVSGIIEMLQPIAQNKGLEISFNSDADRVQVVADRRLLRQALINIVGNAIKFTGEGRIEVNVRSNRRFFSIEVSDTGIGIQKNKIKNIFKDFYRVEQSLTSRYDGVGLGLTLTKRIVDLHGGRIRVKSKYGKGSSFVMRFPVSTGIKGQKKTKGEQDEKS